MTRAGNKAPWVTTSAHLESVVLTVEKLTHRELPHLPSRPAAPLA